MSPTTLPEAWQPLITAAGSIKELTLALGFKAPSSLWRLAHGKMRVSGATRMILAAFCEKHLLAVPGGIE